MKLRTLFFLGVLGIFTVTSAQITLDGEIRPRTAYRHGYSTLSPKNAKPAFFTDQRTRLNFGYKNKQITTYISLQDVRVWGGTRQLNPTDGFLSLHQAWVNIGLDSNISLTVGRQEIILDDHRIFGNVGWATQARSHDAAILKFDNSKIKVDLALAYNQSGISNFDNYYGIAKNYKTMQYLWVHKKFEKVGVSLLALNTGAQVTLLDTLGERIDFKTNFMQTVGTHLEYKNEKLSAHINGYYQFGIASNWDESVVNAYLVGLDLAYNANKKLKITVGYELLSGTSQTDMNNSERNSFNPLFGTNHKFNGFMDYFYVANHADDVGLQDIYLKLNTSVKKTKLGVDIHLFSAASDVLDTTKSASSGVITALSPGLGIEIDIYGAYPINSFAMLKGGYSHMLATGTMEAIKGGDINEVNNWAWLMIIIKPQFTQ